MKTRILALAVIGLVAISGCRTRTSLDLTGGHIAPRWEGKVFVTQESLQPDVEHKIVGRVRAERSTGMVGLENLLISVEGLYPALADQARKIGGNAVIRTSGGRSGIGSPYASGTAVRVDDLEKLKGVNGSYH